jgi:cytoskeletal protein CcmA (bactofilin family)
MLKSEKFFGKSDSSAADTKSANAAALRPAVSTALQPASSASTVSRVVPASIAGPSGAGGFSNTSIVGSNEMRSKLTVGPNIKLKGVEITDCDTLVVEGRVEASIDSRVIQISEKGAFIGNAEFDIAEIRGEFDGELTVRQKLVVYSSGRVTGKIRYGKLVIEEGGQLCGDIQLAGGKSLAVLASA